MTGSEAWSIIAPLIGHHMDIMDGALINQAYVLVFAALQAWDKRKGDGNADRT